MPPKSRRLTARPAANAPKEEVKSSARERARLVAAKINRREGPGTVVQASKALPPPPRISTGSLSFDAALGNGLPANQWTEIVGNESSGKTTFVLKCIAQNMADNPDYTVAWVAAEGWDSKLAQMAGVDEEGIFLIEENVMEKAYDACLDYIADRACDLVVIDSYPALVTQAEEDKDMEGFSPGRGAQVTNQFMRKCTKASKRSLTDADDRPFGGVFINQWREKIGVMHGDPRTTSGGKGKNYWMYCRIDVKRDEWILNKSKEKVGQAIKIVVMKMKGARPQQVGVTDFYFADHGEFKAGEYDTFKALVNLGILFDVIGRSGSGYKGPDGQHIKSMDLLVSTLKSDIEWRARVEDEVLSIAAKGRAIVETDDEDEAELEAEPVVPISRRPRRKTA